MSGVATKLLRRSRSASFSGVLSTSSPSSAIQSPNNNLLVTQDARIKSASVRSLHCSILHPRAPKIRHLNASHALLIDLDKHIAKVQELEYKVTELEARIAEREALKQIPLQDDLSNNQTHRFTANLVTEEDRVAFQNRLTEARRRADELFRKTDLQEANILRSWHSKRLKQVLEGLSTAYNNPDEAAPKLLAAPTADAVQQENKIFDALNALVGMANEEAELNNNDSNYDSHIQQLKNLVIERENLKLMLEGSTQKLAHAHATALECQTSLQNMIASAAALRLQLKSSQAYLMSSLLREDVAQAPSALWIYGPNPIFTGVARLKEISASVQNNTLEDALRKTEISQVVAEKNLAFAQNLVHKHKIRLEAGKAKLDQAEHEIEKQIEAINSQQSTTTAQLVDNVCIKAGKLDLGLLKEEEIVLPKMPDCLIQPSQPVVVN